MLHYLMDGCMVVLLRILPHELDAIDMHQRQKKPHKQIPTKSTHFNSSMVFFNYQWFLSVVLCWLCFDLIFMVLVLIAVLSTDGWMNGEIFFLYLVF